ncbi:MAG: hypothetical protein GY795_48685 [Desulfobacterales bacterium]|nr:hypothetical protein [Desulfobacterales bacterium]
MNTRNDDLSRQVRNLLLLLPVTQLELEKHRLGPENESVFDGIDTLYLSFSMFDFISEKMVFSPGASREDIIEYLCEEVRILKQDISQEHMKKISEIILDKLLNTKEGLRTFSFPYFDALRGNNKIREFRLIKYEVTDDNMGLYYLTNEGFAAYLSMMGIDSDVAQEVDAFLIRILSVTPKSKNPRNTYN